VQIRSLQLVVKEQGVAPSLTQASIALAQGSLPSQQVIALLGHCSGVVPHSSLAPSLQDGGQVIDLSILSSCGCDEWHKPSWDAMGEETCGALLPEPPSFSIPTSSRCSSGVHPNSKIMVCVKINGVVVGRNSSAGDSQVVVHGFLDAESHMKVVKFVNMKPPEVAPLEMSLIHVMHWRLWWLELSSCRLMRKSLWHRPQLVSQHAHHSSPYLGFLLMSVGRSRCHE
jgi:hypothetical protein